MFYKGNPFLTGCFADEDTFIACGYDKAPFRFKKENGEFLFKDVIDEGFNQAKEAVISSNSFQQNKAFFKGQGQAGGLKLDDGVIMKENNTKHSNYIGCLRTYLENKSTGAPQIITTSDVNGYINYWVLNQ